MPSWDRRSHRADERQHIFLPARVSSCCAVLTHDAYVQLKRTIRGFDSRQLHQKGPQKCGPLFRGVEDETLAEAE